jgi:DNA invertase Pin-like site-specific DNA recombinase
MRAAIYVRKSTAQTGMSEDARSVERQKSRARDYATRRGWTIADEHVYEDDGISWAEFARRPGFQRLIETLKRLCPFQYLIVMDESRLGRESIETAHVLKQLMVAGIRIFAYLDDREIVLDNLIDKMRLAFTGLMDEGERYRAQQRTFDALHRKALMGHVTGGRVYGYDNIEIHSSVLDAYGRPKRDHVERRINEQQAFVVRKIFRLCAEGKGMVSVGRRLNDEGCPAPRNSQGRKISWSPSSVRSLLFRRLYLGEVIWNKTKKRNSWGISSNANALRKTGLRFPCLSFRFYPKANGPPPMIVWTPPVRYTSVDEGRAVGQTGQQARFQISINRTGEMWAVLRESLCEKQLPEGCTRTILWLYDAPSSRADRMLE